MVLPFAWCHHGSAMEHQADVVTEKNHVRCTSVDADDYFNYHAFLMLKELSRQRLDLDKIKNHLTDGVAINAYDHDGLTMLHRIAMKGLWQLLPFLEPYCAPCTLVPSVNWEAAINCPVLFEKVAPYLNRCELMPLDIHLPTHDERLETALHVATRMNRVGIVRWLIDHGADLERADAQGNTALHVAASMGHAALVDVLLDKDASMRVVNHNGCTPGDCARQEGDKLFNAWPPLKEVLGYKDIFERVAFFKQYLCGNPGLRLKHHTMILNYYTIALSLDDEYDDETASIYAEAAWRPLGPPIF